jgi:hypothetical protein
MGREEWLLAESIAQELEQAQRALGEVDRLQHEGAAAGDDPEDSRYELAKHALSWYVERSLRSIGALAERMGIASIAVETTKAIRNRKNLAKTDREFEGEIHCAALSHARACFAPLAAMTAAKNVTAHDVLRTILRSTGKIMAMKGPPKNEAEVRNAVLEIFQLAFNDAVRDVPIPKRVSHYKVDIAVRSLRAAIEFKYVDSRDQMKIALEGVYADMRAYHDREWETFYSVFYMTGPYYTQEEIDEEFLYVDADKTWQPIVVQGPGSRRQKNSGGSRS